MRSLECRWLHTQYPGLKRCNERNDLFTVENPDFEAIMSSEILEPKMKDAYSLSSAKQHQFVVPEYKIKGDVGKGTLCMEKRMDDCLHIITEH